MSFWPYTEMTSSTNSYSSSVIMISWGKSEPGAMSKGLLKESWETIIYRFGQQKFWSGIHNVILGQERSVKGFVEFKEPLMEYLIVQILGRK